MFERCSSWSGGLSVVVVRVDVYKPCVLEWMCALCIVLYT